MTDFSVGDRLADAIEGVAYALAHCWQRSPYRTRRDNGILDQEVDKFALLLINVWDQLDSKKAPFIVAPGRHGPGLALQRRGGAPIYICGVIETFQSRIPQRHWLFAVNKANGPWRHFLPLVTMADWDRWKQARTTAGRVVDFFEDLSLLAEDFRQEQVIAFGRHPTPAITARSLDFLAESFSHEFFMFLNNMQDGVLAWSPHLEEFYEVARVGLDKVASDPELYAQARRDILQASKDTAARQALLKCRVAAEDIWGADEVRKRELRTRRIYFLANVVWLAIHSWAYKAGVSLLGRPVARPDEELEAAVAQWESSLAGEESEIPVEDLRLGKLMACQEKLRECFDRAMSDS